MVLSSGERVRSRHGISYTLLKDQRFNLISAISRGKLLFTLVRTPLLFGCETPLAGSTTGEAAWTLSPHGSFVKNRLWWKPWVVKHGVFSSSARR